MNTVPSADAVFYRSQLCLVVMVVMLGLSPETRVAMSAYYKRLWASFSVKLLVNIGSCRLRF